MVKIIKFTPKRFASVMVLSTALGISVCANLFQFYISRKPVRATICQGSPDKVMSCINKVARGNKAFEVVPMASSATDATFLVTVPAVDEDFTK